MTDKNKQHIPRCMELIGITGTYADHYIIDAAIQNQPSLIIDCANKANPHSFFPHTLPEELHHVYVLEVDLLYVFRDVLKQTRHISNKLGASFIAVTRFEGLFHYGDEQENNAIIAHAWELLQELAQDHTVLIALGRKHADQAHQYCTEVRT